MSSPSLNVLENECNMEINKLQIWFTSNELQINLEKSAIIVIPSKLTARPTNLGIFYNKGQINCFESSKYLNVNLNNKLNFKSHVCIIENKVARSVYFNQASFPGSFFCTSFVILFSYSPSSFIWSPIVGKRQPMLS